MQKVGGLKEIFAWVKYHIETTWHYLDMAVLSGYIFDSKIRDQTFVLQNQYGKLKFSIFIFQYTQTVSGHTVNQTLGKTKRGSIEACSTFG